jgi:hypothetical protein
LRLAHDVYVGYYIFEDENVVVSAVKVELFVLLEGGFHLAFAFVCKVHLFELDGFQAMNFLLCKLQRFIQNRLRFLLIFALLIKSNCGFVIQATGCDSVSYMVLTCDERVSVDVCPRGALVGVEGETFPDEVFGVFGDVDAGEVGRYFGGCVDCEIVVASVWVSSVDHLVVDYP